MKHFQNYCNTRMLKGSRYQVVKSNGDTWDQYGDNTLTAVQAVKVIEVAERFNKSAKFAIVERSY